jgi:hypothetical protein
MKPSNAFVAGARPNFMKIAPLMHVVEELRPDFTQRSLYLRCEIIRNASPR